MIFYQIANFSITNLCIEPGLVKRTEIIDDYSLLRIFLNIAKIVFGQGVVILRIHILIVLGVNQHPIRWIIHGRLKDESAVTLCPLDKSDETIRTEIPPNAKVLHRDIAGR